MCIIAISRKGIRQPNKEELQTMWDRNPDGAGYMFVNSDGLVEIHKGFMSFNNFYYNVKHENFTKNDVVIYHFRIATQGGVNPQMTHPFPLTAKLENTKILDCACPVGIVHNGIIPCTTNKNDKEYSDTAHFICEYLSHMVKSEADLHDDKLLGRIESLIHSKMAILDGKGNLATIGNFITEQSGLMFSNSTYKKFTYKYVNLFNRETWLYK